MIKSKSTQRLASQPDNLMAKSLDLTPDEVILQPDEYDLPDYIKASYRITQDKQKQPVKVTRKQIQFFGERGIPWQDVERFYNVNRTTLMNFYLADYEKGKANTNIALRNKMVEIALAGNITALIWLGKNRLNMSDNGPVPDKDEVAAASTWKMAAPIFMKPTELTADERRELEGEEAA